MKTIKITVKGRVQGVFFRHHTKEIAKKLDLSGYVKNLQNGDVEIVAKGSDGRLKELVEFCKKGPQLAKVGGIKIEYLDSKEEFYNFEIR